RIMENEMMRNFAKICISVFISTCYSYTVGRVISKGTTRLFCLLPVIFLFLYLPLDLSSINLSGFTSFLVSWLVNFKLLLFAFGKGPLSSEPSPSLARFVAVACLPIKIKQKPSPKHSKSTLNYVTKAMLFAVLLCMPAYGGYMHPKIIYMLYFLIIYLELEILFSLLAALVRVHLGLDLEPPFNEPYLSTSLQDFWGRRWNLMVTSILRPSVYEPIHNLATASIGSKQAQILAVLATFPVSGLMHEFMFYCMGHEWPTWEVTSFFCLHGLCLAVEISLKKVVGGRWHLPWLISGPLSIGFVIASAYWLFLPSLDRCKAFERGFEELDALLRPIENVRQRLSWNLIEKHMVSWLLNFKILLFAFGKGPLSSEPSLSLACFAAVACLPIKIKQNPSPNHRKKPDVGKKSALNYVIKTILFAVLLGMPAYSSYLHPKIISVLYFLIIYLELEILFSILAALVRVQLGFDLEPPFNEPYLSTSLQDFWGRRWNLMVTSILRPSVYEPMRKLATPSIGSKQAQIPAVLGTFLVSGLMHEFIFYCMAHEWPTWEITSFFCLHGLCLAVEIAVKTVVGDRWKLPWLISGPLSMGFVIASAYWLFLPSLNRCKAFERGFEELDALLMFAKNVRQHLLFL
ncbi:hypothetical protein Tsubulata_041989, partial [Turnera subulata]